MTAAAARRLVLVVEDSDAIRTAFTILLEESGYDVAAAPNGAPVRIVCLLCALPSEAETKS